MTHTLDRAVDRLRSVHVALKTGAVGGARAGQTATRSPVAGRHTTLYIRTAAGALGTLDMGADRMATGKCISGRECVPRAGHNGPRPRLRRGAKRTGLCMSEKDAIEASWNSNQLPIRVSRHEGRRLLGGDGGLRRRKAIVRHRGAGVAVWDDVECVELSSEQSQIAEGKAARALIACVRFVALAHHHCPVLQDRLSIVADHVAAASIFVL